MGLSKYTLLIFILLSPILIADGDNVPLEELLIRYTPSDYISVDPTTGQQTISPYHRSYLYDLSSQIGLRYHERGECEKALPYFNDSLFYTNFFTDGGLKKAQMLGRIGGCYRDLSNYDEAKIYFNQSATIFKELNSSFNYALEIMNFGMAEANTNNLDKAIELLEESKVVFLSIGYEDYAHEIELSIQRIKAFKQETNYVPVENLLLDNLNYTREAHTGDEIEISFDVLYRESNILGLVRTNPKYSKIMFCCGALDDPDKYCSGPTVVSPNEITRVHIPIPTDAEKEISCAINAYTDRNFPKISSNEINKYSKQEINIEFEIINETLFLNLIPKGDDFTNINIKVQKSLLDSIITWIKEWGAFVGGLGGIYIVYSKRKWIFDNIEKLKNGRW